MIDRLRENPIILLLYCCVFGLFFQWLLIVPKPGVALSITITFVYFLYYLSFKQAGTANFRISAFLFFCISLISFSYTLFSNTALLGWSLLSLLLLVVVHLVIHTSPFPIRWYQWSFMMHALSYFVYALNYLYEFLSHGRNVLKRRVQPSAYNAIKMMIAGLIISLPLVAVVTILLVSADAYFAKFLFEFPKWLLELLWGEKLFRLISALIVGFLTFGFFQSLAQPKYRVELKKGTGEVSWNDILMITILISLNLVYFLFVFVQFQYFFSGTIQPGLSYAQYARRGFFELITVTLFNWTVLLTALTFVKPSAAILKNVMRILLSFIILSSGVMLLSAFMRLMLYEQEYGFTTTRFLVYSFMIFLTLIFAYTLVKVWIEKLSLPRFYLITAISCFTLLHYIHIESFVAKQNLQRYEETGKIDLHYLDTLSGPGTLALIQLYTKDSTMPELKNLLADKKQQLQSSPMKWQQFNVVDRNANRQLTKLELE